MQRMNVVLPEPDGPMMQTVSPLRDVEGDALQHLEPAEALVDVDGVHDERRVTHAPGSPSANASRDARPRERPLLALARRRACARSATG